MGLKSILMVFPFVHVLYAEIWFILIWCFKNGRYIVVNNYTTLFRFCPEINELVDNVLYCNIVQELKCYIEQDFVVFVVWMWVWLGRLETKLIFKRRRQTWTNSDLPNFIHVYSLSIGRHEKDCYFKVNMKLNFFDCSI